MNDQETNSAENDVAILNDDWWKITDENEKELYNANWRENYKFMKW